MSIFGGNLSFKISFHLQSKVLLTPWFKRTSSIRCSRDYQSSSGPVRYIPKKSTDNKEIQASNNLEETDFNNFSDSISQPRMPTFCKKSATETVKSGKVFGDVVEFIELKDENNRDEFEEVVDEFRFSGKFKPCEQHEKETSKSEQDAEKIAIEALATRCSRDYQWSSGPVRYSPKKTTDNKEIQTSKNIKETDIDDVSDSIAQPRMPAFCKKSPQQVSFSDTKTVKSGKVFGDVVEFIELEDEKNDQEFEEDVDEFRFLGKETSKSEQDAEKIAIQSLATRAFTAIELQKKLRAKSFAPNVIEKVLTGLQSKGLINDYLYAETFSQSRWSNSTWGPKRIKQALHRKGVSEADAEKATKHVFLSGDDDEPSLGMSKLSVDHLFVQASKQWLRGENVPHEKRKMRIVRWLQYRGFNWGVISFILKKLETQYPP